MAIEFTRCESCGIIFPNQDGKYSQCPKCRNEVGQSASIHDLLRLLKNAIRDTQSRGAFLTVTELSAVTGIEEEKIWHFIHSGEIDTASFNDPEVRNFVVRRKKELMKSTIKAPSDTEAKPEEPARPKSGFHLKSKDDPDKG
jgi:hypothetical protein